MSVAVSDIGNFLGDGDAEKGEFPHYMLKEIYEQPETLANAMRGRLVRRRQHRPLRRVEPLARSSCGRWIVSS